MHTFNTSPLQNNSPNPASPAAFHGRGQRIKNQVFYDDGLTEEQFLDAIENNNMEDVIENKRRKIKKINQIGQPGSNNISGENSLSTTPYYDPDYSSRRGSTHSKRKVAKRGRGGVSPQSQYDPLTPEQRKQLTTIMEHCYNHVLEIKDHGSNEELGPRQRCEIFLELPSKRVYGYYYQVIKQPISMSCIRKKIKSNKYINLEQYRADWLLMFNNAMTFNEEGSIVYNDALVLKVFKKI